MIQFIEKVKTIYHKLFLKKFIHNIFGEVYLVFGALEVPPKICIFFNLGAREFRFPKYKVFPKFFFLIFELGKLKYKTNIRLESSIFRNIRNFLILELESFISENIRNFFRVDFFIFLRLGIKAPFPEI